VDADGSLQWSRIGRLPIRPTRPIADAAPLDPYEFLRMLSTVERRFDAPHLPAPPDRPALAPAPPTIRQLEESTQE